MEKRKNLLQVLGDWWAEHQTQASVERPSPSRPNQILRWFIPNGGTLLLVIALIATAQVWAKPFAAPNAPGPSATTVNYQGHLADPDGNPLDGTYAMEFAIYDDSTGGNLIWGPEEHGTIQVSDGLFSVGLGSETIGGIPTSVWNGDRYLEITVDNEVLSPRELIRSVPIAGMALTVPDGVIGIEQLKDEAFAQMFQSPEISWTETVNLSTDTYMAFPDFSISVEIEQPSKVLLIASAPIEVVSGAGKRLYAGFQKNGVQIGQTHRWVEEVVSGEIWSWNYVETLAPGTYTYRLEAKGYDDMSIRWYRPSVSLLVIPEKQ
jgi:hypothetical protein